ncbi:hypothetical protein [Demequina sp. NBRC 110057]|uniref:hypothetical protein n=1 Tax=Demequina sp. NBRC 110057 TaxID=1570346 RepID=UPI0009FC55BA|nr:hypothetical protein [Demequina sp. NBRC 110057]
MQDDDDADREDLESIAATFTLPDPEAHGDEASEDEGAVEKISRLPMSHTFPPGMSGNGPSL